MPRKKNNYNTVTGEVGIIKKKDLIRRVAKRSGYNIPEVEDILHCLAGEIRNLISEDKDVVLDGIGTLYKKIYPPRKVRNIDGTMHDRGSTVTVTIKPDNNFKHFLKENHARKQSGESTENSMGELAVSDDQR